MQPFSARLKELRDVKELSQNQLAVAAGLSAAKLSRILSKERKLSMEQAISIAFALGVTVYELVDGTELASIINDWVPIEEFEKLDRLIVKATSELEVIKRELQEKTNEVLRLRETVRGVEAILKAAGW